VLCRHFNDRIINLVYQNYKFNYDLSVLVAEVSDSDTGRDFKVLI
jgi:hypothetical protein